jgi:hypothetical protein
VKPADRLRGGSLAVLLILAGCMGVALPPPQQQATPIAGMAPGCQVAPNGGPVTAPPQVADRGIGGTGIPASVQTADRGIGGTGIIGVITGFGSVCLGGQEVSYDQSVPVLVDGRPGTPADLRAGQLALVDAIGPEAALQAQRVLIRHEVTGPVQTSFAGSAAEGPGSRMLRVAGQRVAVSSATLGETAPPVGAWVAVSGFRDPDGIIRATRIDLSRPGEARIAGTLVAEGGHLRIGTAEIVPAPGMILPAGQDVVVVGRWSDGVLYVADVNPDLLTAEPYAFFGPGVATLVIESYAGLNDGRLVLGRVQQYANGQPYRRSVVELARGANGGLQPAVREIGPGANGFGRVNGPLARSTAGVGAPGGSPSGAVRRFEPAPVPNRGANGSRPGGLDSTRGDQRGRSGAANRNSDADTGGNYPNPAIPGPSGYGSGQGSGFGGPAFGGPGFGGPQGGGGRAR